MDWRWSGATCAFHYNQDIAVLFKNQNLLIVIMNFNIFVSIYKNSSNYIKYIYKYFGSWHECIFVHVASEHVHISQPWYR